MWIVSVRFRYQDGPWSDWAQTVDDDERPRAFATKSGAMAHLAFVRATGPRSRKGGLEFEFRVTPADEPAPSEPVD